VSSEKTMQKESWLKGKAEGIEQGKKETMIRVAKELKQKGIPTAVIMECTGLTEIEIDQL